MKYIKFITMFVCLLLLCGCIGIVGPSDKVDQALKKYVNNDRDIIKELNDRLDSQDLTDAEKKRYEKIIKNEYNNIKYEIKNEEITEFTAKVTVDIKVLDLYGASKSAEEDLIDDPTDFYTDGEYDFHKFVDYKLSKMENVKDYKDYVIVFNLTKNDDIWYIDDLDEETLEKLHGIYNYDEKNE